MLRGTQVPVGREISFGYGAITHFGRPSHAVRLPISFFTPWHVCSTPDRSYNPAKTEGYSPLGLSGLGSSAFAHHY